MEITAYIAPNLVAPEHITTLGLFGAILVVAGSISISLGKRVRSNE